MNTKENFKLKKIINYRPLFFGAVLLGLGIFLTTLILQNTLYIVLAAGLLLLTLVPCLILKKYLRGLFLCTVFLLGIGLGFLNIFTYSNNSLTGQSFVLSGRVQSVDEYYESTATVIISGVTAADTSGGNNKINLQGLTSTTIYGYAGNIYVGDTVIFTGKLTAVPATDTYSYRDNIRYSTNASSAGVAVISGSLTVAERLKQITQEKLVEIMGPQDGGIAYATLFGDKVLLDTNIYNNFKAAGTAFLLAVSGIHVAALIAMLFFVLKLFRLNKWVRFVILGVVLLAYCYLCGFSPSVVRAGIMGMCFVLGSCLGERSDSLSNLGLSAIIILVFKPLYIFNVGFLLSYAAVLSIILCLKLMSVIKIKSRVVKYLADTAVISFAATLGTAPIVCAYFGVFPTFTLLASIIIMPLYIIGFIAVWLITVLGLILPIFWYVLFIPAAFFEVIVYLNNFIAGLPFAVIDAAGFGLIAALLFYLTIFGASHYTMLKAKWKSVAVTALLIACIICAVVFNIPAYNNKNAVVFNNSSMGYYSLLTTSANDYYAVDLVVTKTGLAAAKQNLLNNKIRKLSGLIFTNNSNVSASTLSAFMQFFGQPAIYISENNSSYSSLVAGMYDVVPVASGYKTITEGGIAVMGYQTNNVTIATQLEINTPSGTSRIIIVKGSLTPPQISFLNSTLNFNINYLYLENYDTNPLTLSNVNNFVYNVAQKQVVML